MPTYYAYHRSLDARTGQPVVSSGKWVPGSPMLEVVIRVLRTPRGTFMADPAFGPDYSLVEKATANAAGTLISVIQAALKFLTDPGLIQDLRVVTETRGTTLLADVSFFDPALGRRGRARVRL